MARHTMTQSGRTVGVRDCAYIYESAQWANSVNEDIECTNDESLPLVDAATTSHGGDNRNGEILLLGHI